MQYVKRSIGISLGLNKSATGRKNCFPLISTAMEEYERVKIKVYPVALASSEGYLSTQYLRMQQLVTESRVTNRSTEGKTSVNSPPVIRGQGTVIEERNKPKTRTECKDRTFGTTTHFSDKTRSISRVSHREATSIFLTAKSSCSEAAVDHSSKAMPEPIRGRSMSITVTRPSVSGLIYRD